ncbi:MAG: hypothetical protein ACE5OO_06780 [Candidatus Bathyarchaeia archaeon]
MSGETGGVEAIRKHRYVYLAVLMMPVFGIVIALVLVSLMGFPKLGLIFLALSFLLIQYLLFVAYIWRRMPS